MSFEKLVLDPDLGMGFRSLEHSTVDELIHSGGVSITTSDVSYISCAGYVSFDQSDTVLFKGNLEGQARQVFQHLEKCLADAGAGIKDIVRYRAHFQPPFDEDQLAIFNSVAAETFRSAGIEPPAATLIITELAAPNLLIEIDCDALVSRELEQAS